MKTLLISAFIYLMTSPGFASENPCPIPTLGETQLDCPWAGISRDLNQESNLTGDAFTDEFVAKAPKLAVKIRADRALENDLSVWGTSINFDELTHAEIVSQPILGAIYQLAHQTKLGTKDPLVNGTLEHAGLEHTYGYVFSDLRTSFGYKRARWVQGEIEAGFGLPAETLSPLPPVGSLLSNVSQFAGRIAFRTDPVEHSKLDIDASKSSPAIQDFNYLGLKPTRISEIVPVGDQRITLRTDIIPFFNIPKDPNADSALLIYSIRFEPLTPTKSDVGYAKLITVFPVQSSFVKGITPSGSLGEGQPITTHYNGYVSGLSGKKIAGTRKVE